MKTEFVWDPAKDASNLRKHGVDFETASRVFADPQALMDQDRIEGGDLVEIIRIISARGATRKERQRYEQEAR